MKKPLLQISIAVVLMTTCVGFASASETAAKKPLVKAYPGTDYSPYAENAAMLFLLYHYGAKHIYTQAIRWMPDFLVLD